jgi:hypothetical protein
MAGSELGGTNPREKKMAKRRRKGGANESVSLFPFLSVLACVIGSLTLMIAAVALGQMDTGAVADAFDLERYLAAARRDRESIADLQQKLEKAQKEASDEAAMQKDLLARAQTYLSDLEKQLAEARQDDDPPREQVPTVDLAAHEKRMEDMRTEIKTTGDEVKQLQSELAAREKKPEEAQVRIQPSGSGVGLKPTFIECDGSGIVIHDGEKPRRVRRADLKTDEAYLALLEKIAKQPKHTIVFLLRKNGIGAYVAARDVAWSRGAKNGKLPVPTDGKIDLSMFE